MSTAWILLSCILFTRRTVSLNLSFLNAKLGWIDHNPGWLKLFFSHIQQTPPKAGRSKKASFSPIALTLLLWAPSYQWDRPFPNDHFQGEQCLPMPGQGPTHAPVRLSGGCRSQDIHILGGNEPLGGDRRSPCQPCQVCRTCLLSTMELRG